MKRLTRDALLEVIDDFLDICPLEGTEEECRKSYIACRECSRQALADYEEEIRSEEREKVLEEVRRILFGGKEIK